MPTDQQAMHDRQRAGARASLRFAVLVVTVGLLNMGLLALHEAGELNESALLNFAKAFKYEESVAALAAMSGVKIETLDHLISGDRYDPILIAGKSLGLEWATVRALILLRLGPNRVVSPADIETARVNFARLMPTTAERVVGFWKSRPQV